MTIIDVAKEAGVSKSTVSRVINGRQTVDPAIARRVQAAMTKLDFVPKVNRRGPKPKATKALGFRTGTIGFLLMGRSVEFLEHPHIARLLAGAADAMQRQDLNLMILEMPNPAGLPTIIRDRGIDGLLICGTAISRQIVDMLHPLPFVWLGGQAPAIPLADGVCVNNPAAGQIAATYLTDVGIKSFAYVNNIPSHSAFLGRRDAFLEHLKDQGHPALCLETQPREGEVDLWNSEAMQRDMNTLVARVLKRKVVPDGFFLPTDQQAAAFRRAMAAKGLKPERDFFTISCNKDEPWLATMCPRPATIDTRPNEIGRRAVAQLVHRVKNPTDDILTISIRPELVLPNS